MRLFKLRSRRGQATVELALASPLVFGLLALTLQGGIILSDQVNLEHYAYEGAQWALANPDATSAAVADHIKQQMCGGVTTIGTPGPNSSRYCQAAPAGVGGLIVEVNAGGTHPTPLSMGPVARPTGAVLAASTCKAWHLDVSDPVYSSGSAIPLNGNGMYTITLNVSGTTGSDPVVALTASGYPLGLATGSPVITPPTLYYNGKTATLVVSVGAKVPQGTSPYDIGITGQDQCGQGPTALPTVKQLKVGSGSGFGSIPLPPLVTVDPLKIDTCANTPTTFHMHGRNISAGATVQFGQVVGVATSVVATGASSQVDSTATLPAGIYDIIITNLDGTKAIATGGLTILQSGSCPVTNPPSPVHPCSGNVAGGYQSVIHIRWSEPLALPLLTTGAPPQVQLDANQTVFCQQ